MGEVLLYTIHHTPYTINPTPNTPHFIPCTLHHTPHTLYPTPYTPHSTPYTLHPTPKNQNAEAYTHKQVCSRSDEASYEHGGRTPVAYIQGGEDGDHRYLQGYLAHKKQPPPRTLQ